VSTTEVIVRIAAEGGSITLIGNKDPNLDWQFARGVNDQTPLRDVRREDAFQRPTVLNPCSCLGFRLGWCHAKDRIVAGSDNGRSPGGESKSRL